MKQLKFEKTITSVSGKEYMVCGKAEAHLCYDKDPCGIGRDHPYAGHQGGWYFEGWRVSAISVFNIIGKRDYFFEYLTDVPEALFSDQELKMLENDLMEDFLNAFQPKERDYDFD